MNTAQKIEGAEVIELEKPRPLRRPIAPPSEYPVDALGSIIGEAVRGVVDIVQLPPAIAAHSALANAALAVQGHADIRLPHGEITPVSLFLLSVARSGDRKSTADKLLASAVQTREMELQEIFNQELVDYENEQAAYDTARNAAKNGKNKGRDEIRTALEAVGDEPAKPRYPSFTADDPTIEGVHKYLATGQPSLGVFNDEGGMFSGGVGMSQDNALKTAAAFSKLWDGSAVKRMRAGDGFTVLRGRRVSMHLMMQPGAAMDWLCNPVVRDQGLFGRLLVVAPDSLAGSRLYHSVDTTSQVALNRFSERALSIFRVPFPYNENAAGELKPRVIGFSSEAANALRDYGDALEKEQRPGGTLEPIVSLAGKAVGHAGRLAAVLTLFDNMQAQEISAENMARGIKLSSWYLDEALRIAAAGFVRPEIRDAEKLKDWLRDRWPEISKTGDNGRLVSLPDIYQQGPNAMRDAKSAQQSIDILIEHGWVRAVDGRHRVNAQMRSKVFAFQGGE